jgi:hypothetical protein
MEEVHTGFGLGDLTRREHLGNVDRKIILKCISLSGMGRHRLDYSGSG